MIMYNFITFIILILVCLSGLGFFYSVRSILSNKYSEDLWKGNFILGLPIGFSVSYSFFCLFYYLIVFFADNSIAALYVLFISQLIIGNVLFVIELSKQLFKKNVIDEIQNNSLFNGFSVLIILLFIMFILVPQLLLGNSPFLVSDSWGHISIVNRMIDSGSIVLSSFSMPDDHYLLKYSPHHAFLAIVANAVSNSALDIYKVARIFYPFMLVMSLLLLLSIIDKQYLKNALSISLTVIIFAIVFPTTDGIWRGAADYRIPAFILMLVSLSLIYPVVCKQEQMTVSKAVSITFLSLAIAATHVIEISFLTLLVVPAGAYFAFKYESNKITKFTVYMLLVFSVSGLFGLLQSRAAYTPLNKIMSYSEFVSYAMSQIDIHVSLYTYYISVFFAFFTGVVTKNKDLVIFRFLMISFFVSMILGPLNPLLYPVYKELMGSSHSNRILYYSFPFYLALVIGVLHLVDRIGSNTISINLKMSYVGLLLLVVLALGINVYKRAGLNGDFSYKSSDKYSQLKLYPDFYAEFAKRYQHKVIISDVFTSAPVNAVTSNYVFTSRPWIGGEDNRFQSAKQIMSNPFTAESTSLICSYGIDVMLINTNKLPKSYEEIFSTASWLMSDFKAQYNPELLNSVNGFKFIDSIDGINIYEFERDKICS